MTTTKSKVNIIGPAPVLHGISVETDDYCVMLAQFDDGPTGYVVQNKHTGVLEYVARAYGEAAAAVKSLQNTIDDLKKASRPTLKTVQ